MKVACDISKIFCVKVKQQAIMERAHFHMCLSYLHELEMYEGFEKTPWL